MEASSDVALQVEAGRRSPTYYVTLCAVAQAAAAAAVVAARIEVAALGVGS